MGWLGAMAGAGKGLQDYASIMGENRKLAWEQQQSDIAYQRQLNLEQLRKQNNMELATTQRTWGQEDQAAAEAREEKTYQRRVGESEADYQRRRNEQIQDRKIGFDEQLATAKQAMGMELQAKKDFLQYRLDEAGKAGASEEDKRKLTLVTLFPELGEVILTSERSNRLKPEDSIKLISESTKLLEMGYSQWENKSDKDQKKFMKNFEVGKKEDAAELFANNFVFQKLNENPAYRSMMSGEKGGTGLSFIDGPKGEDTTTGSTGSEKTKPESSTSFDPEKVFNSLDESKRIDLVKFAKNPESTDQEVAFMKLQLGGEDNYNKIMEYITSTRSDYIKGGSSDEGESALGSISRGAKSIQLGIDGINNPGFLEWMKENYPNEDLKKSPKKMRDYRLGQYKSEVMK